jgi:hypothetical protein
MQNDQLISETLRQDHARLAGKLAARPIAAIVLARLEHRGRFRGLVLATAAGLGAVIAAAALLSLVPKGPLELSPTSLSFALGSLVLVATIGALGRAIAD